jgi:uncharacterized membrane protein YqgA involved in biofilm formation
MNGILEVFYRIVSWTCTGLAWVNATIVLWDGCTGELQMQYRVVTLLVALLFGSIGGVVLGLERSLDKILRWYTNNPGVRPDAELVGAWRSLHVLLAVSTISILAVMGSGLVAIISRLHEGFRIFG